MARPNQMRQRAAMLLFVLTSFLPLPAAQDWPQWRGSSRDGTIVSFVEPKAWPDQLKQMWQVTVGAGYSSSLPVNKRIYILTRQGEEEVVRCLEE